MGVKVITPATQQIPTADLRAHCRIDPVEPTTDAVVDAQLQGFLAAAVGYAEHYTQRSIGSQTLEMALDAFPVGAIELERGPVTSITSIKYIDASGVEQTLSNTLYTLDDYGLVPAVQLVSGASWPSTQVVANAVKVRYVAGSLPDAVKSALLLTVAHLNENREASGSDRLAEIPMGVDCLLDTVKVWGM